MTLVAQEIDTDISLTEDDCQEIAAFLKNVEQEHKAYENPKAIALNEVLKSECGRMAGEIPCRHTKIKTNAFAPIPLNLDDAALAARLTTMKTAATSHRGRGFFGVLGVIKDNFWYSPPSYTTLVKFEAEKLPSPASSKPVSSQESTSCCAFLSGLNPFACFYKHANDAK